MTHQNILYVEDDWELAGLVAEDLTDRGFRVRLAHDGQQGLELIQSESPDLVLADISMPLMSGFEMLKRLRDMAPQFSQIPVVFFSALSDVDNEFKGRNLGACDYVRKPVDFQILADTIIRQERRLVGVMRKKQRPRKILLHNACPLPPYL